MGVSKEQGTRWPRPAGNSTWTREGGGVTPSPSPSQRELFAAHVSARKPAVGQLCRWKDEVSESERSAWVPWAAGFSSKQSLSFRAPEGQGQPTAGGGGGGGAARTSRGAAARADMSPSAALVLGVGCHPRPRARLFWPQAPPDQLSGSPCVCSAVQVQGRRRGSQHATTAAGPRPASLAQAREGPWKRWGCGLPGARLCALRYRLSRGPGPPLRTAGLGRAPRPFLRLFLPRCAPAWALCHAQGGLRGQKGRGASRARAQSCGLSPGPTVTQTPPGRLMVGWSL